MKAISFPMNAACPGEFEDFMTDHFQKVVSSSDLLVFIKPIGFEQVQFGRILDLNDHERLGGGFDQTTHPRHARRLLLALLDPVVLG